MYDLLAWAVTAGLMFYGGYRHGYEKGRKDTWDGASRLAKAIVTGTEDELKEEIRRLCK